MDFRHNKSGGQRGIGSLLLGGDCTVEFCHTTKNEQTARFLSFYNIWGNKKLELGGSTLERL